MSDISSSPASGTHTNVHVGVGEVVPYEQQLSRDLRWAMGEGSLFFENRGKVQESMQRIVRRLEELGIPYAVSGGMALYLHGFRRFTEDVDILVSSDSLNQIHNELGGRGYVRPFDKSKNLRDTQSGVKIEFLVAGQFPGDGKPKEIAFPDPEQVTTILGGIRVINLPALISLKLASGMTGGLTRAKDFTDVIELIKTLRIPESTATLLHPYVRDKFLEIWRALDLPVTRYLNLLPKKRDATSAKSIDDLIVALRRDADNRVADELEAMRADGVTLAPVVAASDEYVLVTTDRHVAEKYGMADEKEYFGLNMEEKPKL